MTLNHYQKQAMTTCMESSNNIAYMFFNLLGEVGELTEKVNDYIQDRRLNKMADDLCMYGTIAKDIRKEPDHWYSKNIVKNFEKYKEAFKDSALIQKECGDILWQLTGFCSVMGWNIEDIAQQNLDKLASRKERGKIDGDGDNR